MKVSQDKVTVIWRKGNIWVAINNMYGLYPRPLVYVPKVAWAACQTTERVPRVHGSLGYITDL